MKAKKIIPEIKQDSIFISCSCSGEILRVDSNTDKITKQNYLDTIKSINDGVLITEDEFKATEDDDNLYYFQEFWLSLYSHGTYNLKPTILYRIKRAWEFIKTGEFSSDSIIINRESARQLIKYLQEKLDKFE